MLQSFVPSAHLLFGIVSPDHHRLCGVLAYKIATSCEHKPSDHSVHRGNVFVLDVLIACVYVGRGGGGREVSRLATNVVPS